MQALSRSSVTLCGFLLLLTTSLPSAQAALTISHTRIVHESDKRSSSVTVANPSKIPFAAQAWVNTEADDTSTSVPLIASPNLFRLDPGNEQTIQINALPNDLAQDRESLFYFNLQEIPQATDDSRQNVLNVALRTRIKVFYRPSQVKGRPADRLKDLAWSVQQIDGKLHLIVDNPSPYHFTFSNLTISGAGFSENVDAAEMALPLGRQIYPLRSTSVADNLQVKFSTINDYSGITPEHSSPVTRH